MKKIVFMGSKPIGYNCLKYLIDNQENLDCKIISVLTNDNTRFDKNLSVKELANTNNIKIHESLNDYLNDENPDLLISIQYHEILKKIHIDKAKLCINLHMAPLPEYRGCNQFSFAIINQDKTFGTTIHVLEEGIDSGDIISEERFSISENIWVSELYNITYEKSLELFKKEIKNILDGNFKKVSQESLLKTRKTSIHYRKEISKIKVLDLSWDKEKIERFIRATYMPGFEPPYAIFEDKKIYFKVDNYD